MQLWNNKLAPIRNQYVRCQNKKTLFDLQNVIQKPVHPENVPAETRGREWLDGTQSGAQSDECWTS